MALHIRHRGRRRGHFSSSGFYYKGNNTENDPRRFTICGAEPTDKDFGWAERNFKRAQEAACRECLAAAR